MENPPTVTDDLNSIFNVAGIPPRRNIETYFPGNNVTQDPELQRQWTLFVLALERFQKVSVDDTYSYFQVAGIHGYPTIPWNDCPPPKGDFFCAHARLDFSTWHRPYLHLFENCVIKHMEALIKSWKLPAKEQAAWSSSASSWRLPYWDWAAKQALPYVLTIPETPIFPPPTTNLKSPVKNPFWKFENPETKDGKPLPMGEMPEGKEKYNIPDHYGKPWKKCSGTSRYGLKSVGSALQGTEGINNFEAANAVLATYSMSPPTEGPKDPVFTKPAPLRDAVARMFSAGYHTSWGTFASKKWRRDDNKATQYLNLEQIHDDIHLITGGLQLTEGCGHMCDAGVSAFDPIFWLHHCNIDRLLVIWQLLNSRKWWDGPLSSDDKKASDPLYPFRNSNGPEGFYSSDQVRYITTFDYSYDVTIPKQVELDDEGKLREEIYQNRIRAMIQDTYADTPKLAEWINENEQLSNIKYLGAENGNWKDYLVNVLYDRYALNGQNYVLVFYLGEPHQVVGSVNTFSGLPLQDEMGGPGCENCSEQQRNGVLHKAQIPITIPIMKRAINNHFVHTNDAGVPDDSVKDYIKNNLKWRYVTWDGEVPHDRFPRTVIKVWQGLGKPYEVDSTATAGADPLVLTQYDDYDVLLEPADLWQPTSQ